MSVYDELMNEAVRSGRGKGGNAPRSVGRRTRPRSERGMPSTQAQQDTASWLSTPEDPVDPSDVRQGGFAGPKRTQVPKKTQTSHTEYEGPSLKEKLARLKEEDATEEDAARRKKQADKDMEGMLSQLEAGAKREEKRREAAEKRITKREKVKVTGTGLDVTEPEPQRTHTEYEGPSLREKLARLKEGLADPEVEVTRMGGQGDNPRHSATRRGSPTTTYSSGRFHTGNRPASARVRAARAARAAAQRRTSSTKYEGPPLREKLARLKETMSKAGRTAGQHSHASHLPPTRGRYGTPSFRDIGKMNPKKDPHTVTTGEPGEETLTRAGRVKHKLKPTLHPALKP